MQKMSRIYLHAEDVKTLTRLKELADAKDAEIIENILQRHEENRKHLNDVAKEYKRYKRSIDKNYARSKKEIAARSKKEASKCI